MSVHVCTVDESAQEELEEDWLEEDWPGERNLRAELLGLWDIVSMGRKYLFLWAGTGQRLHKDRPAWNLETVLWALRYQSQYPARRRRTPMDVPGMIQLWHRLVKGLSTAHDKTTVDNCEFDMEGALGPILTAPVKELREFYKGLVAALRKDPKIPFFVWQMFEVYGQVIIEKATKDEVVELKTKLAHEIAERVEKEVALDLKDALVGALQWRSEKSLERIKKTLDEREESLEDGAAPKKRARLTGKESCLFLQVGKETVML